MRIYDIYTCVVSYYMRACSQTYVGNFKTALQCSAHYDAIEIRLDCGVRHWNASAMCRRTLECSSRASDRH